MFENVTGVIGVTGMTGMTAFLSAIVVIMVHVASLRPKKTARVHIDSDVLSLILLARPGACLPLNRDDRKRFDTMVRTYKNSAILIQDAFRKRNRKHMSMLVNAYQEI